MGKISAQPYTTLCIQFLNRENNDKNNTFPLGKQICFTIVWGCAETLPRNAMSGYFRHPIENYSIRQTKQFDLNLLMDRS